MSVERDEFGAERVAGEALLTGTSRDVDAARRAGFEVISEWPLIAAGGEIARLHVTVGMGVNDAVAALQSVAPQALVSANHIYRGSEAHVSRTARTRRASAAAIVGVLGIIDTGVDTSSVVTPSAILSQHAFAGVAPIAREHGSVVAALAIEHGMQVHVADVFGQSADGGLAASADSIAAALDWMIANNITVINVSIEGPNNAVLAQMVRRAAERGHVIVAAAGNGGPLARPAFPAAFEGSVAVTAIDDNNRPYMRANRGAYIAFAAPGVELSVRTTEADLVVSGTSFATPLVAARIAERMSHPSPRRARDVLVALQSQVIDLGAPGRDPIFGWGALHDD
jgi:subtilisin family serine protease